MDFLSRDLRTTENTPTSIRQTRKKAITTSCRLVGPALSRLLENQDCKFITFLPRSMETHDVFIVHPMC